MVRLARSLLLGLALAVITADGFAGGEYSDNFPAAGANQVIVGVPSFSSKQGELGLNVATILGLQIFTTFRKADLSERTFFGDALVLWSPLTLDGSSHEDAEKWGKAKQCRLVLWGEVVPYAGHVLVQAQLSTLPGSGPVHPEVLTLRVPGQGDARFTPPTTRYNFTPLVLKQDVVDQYKNPGALVLRSHAHGRGKSLGPVGPAFKALISTPSDVQVTAQQSGKTGWINLPLLAQNQSEVSDFISGLVRVFRADYVGAQKYLLAVIENPEAGITVKTDAHLYLAVAAYRSMDVWTAQKHVASARELDPFGAGAALASLFMALHDAIDGDGKAGVRKQLAAMRGIVAEDDPLVRLAQDFAK